MRSRLQIRLKQQTPKSAMSLLFYRVNRMNETLKWIVYFYRPPGSHCQVFASIWTMTWNWESIVGRISFFFFSFFLSSLVMELLKMVVGSCWRVWDVGKPSPSVIQYWFSNLASSWSHHAWMMPSERALLRIHTYRYAATTKVLHEWSGARFHVSSDNAEQIWLGTCKSHHA